MSKKTDDILVREVQKYPHLYVVSDKHFRNKVLKEYTWKAIANTMGWTPNECQRRWKNLRDKFAREQKAKMTSIENGSEKDGEEWYMMSTLSFLTDHVKHRSVSSKNEEAKMGNGVPTLPTAKELLEIQAILQQEQGPDQSSGINTQAEEIIVGCDVSEIALAESTDSNSSQQFNQRPDCVLDIKQEDDSTDNNEDYIPEVVHVSPGMIESRPTRKRLRKNDSGVEDIDTAILRVLEEMKGDRSENEIPKFSLSQLSEDELFCMSVTAELSKLTPKQKSFAKMSIQKLLYDIKYGSPQI